MKKIVAICGDVLNGKTTIIDKYIVSLAVALNPRLLVITTNVSSEAITNKINKVYKSLGCIVTILNLDDNENSTEDFRKEVLSSDIVYFSDSCDSETSEKFNLEKVLMQASRRDIVIVGINDGANCLFNFGYQNIKNGGNTEHKFIRGFGLIPYYLCHHFESTDSNYFEKYVLAMDQEAFALESGVSLVVLDGKYSIIKDEELKRAFIFKKSRNIINREELLK